METALMVLYLVTLANSVKKGLFDYSAVERHLKEADEKKTFRQLVLVSLAFYKSEGLKFAWFRKLLNSAKLNLSRVDEVREEVKKGKEQRDGLNLSAERMTNVFKKNIIPGSLKRKFWPWLMNSCFVCRSSYWKRDERVLGRTGCVPYYLNILQKSDLCVIYFV